MINVCSITIAVAQVGTDIVINTAIPDDEHLKDCSQEFKNIVKDLHLRIDNPVQWYKEFTDKNLQKLKESESKVDNRSQV